MSKETKIEWADSTVNFWSGCTKVSAGCAECYAETLSNRKLTNKAGQLNIGQWGKGAPRKLHESAFKLAFQLNKKPLVCSSCGFKTSEGWVAKVGSTHCDTKLHRRRVFSLSLGDWLDPEVPIDWLAEMLDTIRKCDQVQWLLVTKRPELFFDRIFAAMLHAEKADPKDEQPYRPGTFCRWLENWKTGYEPKHIMVLTSVEDQKAADERIPKLLEIPGHHGLSCEPLLGPVNIPEVLKRAIGYNPDGTKRCNIATPNGVPMIDWVIIGGESGPGARACETKWIRSLMEQCRSAGVATFVKQLGSNPSCECGELPQNLHPKGGDILQWPADLRVRQFPEFGH